MAAAVLRVRTDRGEERLDLEEFENKVVRGEIAPQCPVLFPAVTGDTWVAAGSLEIFKQLYSPRRLHFSRAFSLGRIPRVTFLFIAANILWFLAMQLWPSADPVDTLLRFGAKAGPLMLDLGQFWRLITANLVHKDVLHIAVNLFVIFNFAGALENAFRPLDMALILSTSALGTTLCSFAATDPVSAGASGVAYGAFSGSLGHGRMEMLEPVGPDMWALPCPRALDHTPPGDWTLAFRRNSAGRVDGVEVGCWLARRLEYGRVE